MNTSNARRCALRTAAASAAARQTSSLAQGSASFSYASPYGSGSSFFRSSFGDLFLLCAAATFLASRAHSLATLLLLLSLLRRLVCSNLVPRPRTSRRPWLQSSRLLGRGFVEKIHVQHHAPLSAAELASGRYGIFTFNKSIYALMTFVASNTRGNRTGPRRTD